MEKNKFSNISLTPVGDSLKGAYTFVDNEIQDSIKKLKFFKHIKQYSKTKRSGWSIESTVFTLLVWVYLKNDSIKMFYEKRLSIFFKGGKDVLYETMRDEGINWRQVSVSTAKEIYVQNNIANETETAFVIDDTIKERSGRKVEGISSHFEHSHGRYVMGHQMIELGLAFRNGFLPLDRQIFIGDKKAHLLNNGFKDSRSAAAQDFKSAIEMDKNEMFRSMLQRAIRKGFMAKYCLADSWFCSKKNIRTVIYNNLTGILRTKRSKLNYLFNGKLYTLVELYFLLRRRFRKNSQCKWKTFSAVVKIDLSEDIKIHEYIQVKLVFSAPKDQKKDQWAAFLSTDIKLRNEDVLRVYALRWGVEVYFKEIKQNMGFLKEQSWSYVSHYASIHLTSIRYMLLFDILLLSGNCCSFGSMRNALTGKLEMLTFAAMLWELFKAIIYGVLDSFKELIGEEILNKIKCKISSTIEEFLEKALQLDESYIANELKAERIGALL
ncbi:MAG: transposase [Lentisphaerota bacterium]